MQSRAVVLVIFSATIVLGQECKPEMAQQCYQQQVNPATDIWPSNKEELKKMCTDLGIVLDCLMPHIENCPDFTKKAFDGLGTMQREICDESSSTAKGYLRHGGCLRHNIPQMLRCAESKMKTRPSHPCVFVSSIFQCADETYGKLCGADANQFAKYRYAVNLKPMCPDEVKDYLSPPSSAPSPPSSASSLKYSVNLVFMFVAAMLWIRL